MSQYHSQNPWKLPNHWEWAAIKDIGQVVSGGTPSTKSREYWNGTVNWISPADLSGFNGKYIARGAKSISQLGLDNSSAKLLPKGTLLFSSRAPVGYVAIAAEPLATNQGFKNLVPKPGLDPEYLYYYLKASKDLAEARASGTTFKELSGKAFSQLPIAIPPFNEQPRIVAKIEELFSELDNGLESLKAARAQLKTYRQSLLKAAFEGRLSEQWRSDNGDKLETADQLLQRICEERETRYERQMDEWREATSRRYEKDSTGAKPKKPSRLRDIPEITDAEREVLPTVPEHWRYTRLSSVAAIGSGMSVSKSRQLGTPIEVPYLRVANVQRGLLQLDSIKYMKIEADDLEKLRLRQWDVLFNEGGDRDQLGRGWVWESQIDPCITQNHVFRATTYLGDEYQAKFISYWGNTFGRSYFEKFGKQTTNLASINKGVLSLFPIPVPPYEEQKGIVRMIESAESEATALQSAIERELNRSETLRQSILKRAFEGKLVPQDPDDEPARVLLERIRDEQKEAPKPRGRQRKANA